MFRKNISSFLLLLSLIAMCSGSLVRPKRHVGQFFKHLQPIIENPFITEPFDSNKTPESDSTTLPPNPTDMPKDTESPASTDSPPSNPMSSEPLDSSPVTDQPENSENVETSPTSVQDDSSPGQEKSSDEPSATDPIPNSDPETSPSSNQDQTPVNFDLSQSTSTSSSDSKEPSATNPTTLPESQKVETTPPTPQMDDSDKPAESKPNEISSTEPSAVDAGNPTSPESIDSSGTDPSGNIETQSPTTPPQNSRKGKSMEFDSPDSDSPAEKTESPTEASAEKSPVDDKPKSTGETPVSEMCSPVVTTIVPENANAELPTTTPSLRESSSPSSTTPDESPEESADTIAALLDKLNAQKKILDDQIAESRKSLDSVTEILNNDRNRKLNEVINQAQEEEVKPLADELQQNTTEYDRVLDPAVISNATKPQWDEAKQFINERVGIPAHSQLMDSYLGLKMADPNVKFDQRVKMLSLISETHVDCIRNRQYKLRNPLEMMLAKMTCITKSTDPGKIPPDWQPNNYLSRGTMNQIRECNQPANFYTGNPFGRFTVIIRRIQDNYQDRLGTFQNIQKKFTQQVNSANQEVSKMREQCERQKQLQMESEQLPQLPKSYLPAPEQTRQPEAAASSQWYTGQWRPSQIQGYPYYR